jgi:hypothetical protein
VLVVHLKRFRFEVNPVLGPICRKLAVRVVPDRAMDLGSCCCPGQPAPKLLLSMMSREDVAARAARRAAAGGEQAGNVAGGGVRGNSAGKGGLLLGGLSSQAGGEQKHQQEGRVGDEDELIVEEEEDKENQCGVSAGQGGISKQRVGSLTRTATDSAGKGQGNKINPFVRRLGAGNFHGVGGTVAKKVRLERCRQQKMLLGWPCN